MTLAKLAELLVDPICALVPRRRPSDALLSQCRLVAHRGAHRAGKKENTLEAFDVCQKNGIWGVEFDIRWTRDQVPVVIHDADTRRIFSDPVMIIAETTAADLRAEHPQIPRLSEVLRKFGKHLHYMIELKEDLDSTRIQRLQTELQELTPVKDFHLISLKGQRLVPFLDFYPSESLVTIATVNSLAMCRQTLELKLGGYTGPYLLTTKKQINELHQSGKAIGTGFVASKSVLYREVRRGVDWIFTNCPLTLNEIIRDSRKIHKK